MRFEIKVKGVLDENWSDWLGEVAMAHAEENGEPFTLIRGEATDPPTLYGILEHLRDLNLPLISVIQVE